MATKKREGVVVSEAAEETQEPGNPETSQEGVVIDAPPWLRASLAGQFAAAAHMRDGGYDLAWCYEQADLVLAYKG